MNYNMTADSILKLIDMLSHSIETEEKFCEQRITYFLTLSTATIGTVSVLDRINRLTSDQFFWSMLTVLISLLIYGLHTLNRLNWRYIEIHIRRDQLINALQELSSGVPLIENLLGIRRRFDKRVQKNWFTAILKGSPAEFMYITNAFIVAGIVLTLALRAHWFTYHIITLCFITFTVTVIVQWKTCASIRRRLTDEQSSENSSKRS